MKFFKNYANVRLMPATAWDDIFELLSSIDGDDAEQWLEAHAKTGFTLEEFIHYLRTIDHEEVQDWLWIHREEFEAVLGRASYNFDNAQVMDGKQRWHRLFLMTPNKPTDGRGN